jgi:hypothetical protein
MREKHDTTPEGLDERVKLPLDPETATEGILQPSRINRTTPRARSSSSPATARTASTDRTSRRRKRKKPLPHP